MKAWSERLSLYLHNENGHQHNLATESTAVCAQQFIYYSVEITSLSLKDHHRRWCAVSSLPVLMFLIVSSFCHFVVLYRSIFGFLKLYCNTTKPSDCYRSSTSLSRMTCRFSLFSSTLFQIRWLHYCSNHFLSSYLPSNNRPAYLRRISNS